MLIFDSERVRLRVCSSARCPPPPQIRLRAVSVSAQVDELFAISAAILRTPMIPKGQP